MAIVRDAHDDDDDPGGAHAHAAPRVGGSACVARSPSEAGGAGRDDRHAGRHERRERQGDRGAEQRGARASGGPRSCGTSSARNRAGKAASSPNVAGSPITSPNATPSDRAAHPRGVQGQPGAEQHLRVEPALALGGDRPGLVDHELGVQEARPAGRR